MFHTALLALLGPPDDCLPCGDPVWSGVTMALAILAAALGHADPYFGVNVFEEDDGTLSVSYY